MNKKELLDELQVKFEETKEQLGFNSTFEEIESIYYIKDFVLTSGFLSERFDRMLCARIRDTLHSWISHFHSVIMPNPSSIFNMTENSAFNDDERKEIDLLMHKFMAFVSKNIVIGINNKVKEQGEFIDEGVKIWKDNLPALNKFSVKIQENWEKNSKQ